MILVDAWEIYWAINPINKARKLHLVAIKSPEKQIFPHSTDYDAAWSIRGYSFSPSWMLPSHFRLRQRNFIEKTFWCGCSPVNLLPISRDCCFWFIQVQKYQVVGYVSTKSIWSSISRKSFSRKKFHTFLPIWKGCEPFMNKTRVTW